MSRLQVKQLMPMGVRERWGTVERGVREFLARLSEEVLTRPLSYVNLKGET
jgi:hypothetical protein